MYFDVTSGRLTGMPQNSLTQPWHFVPQGKDVWRCVSGTNDGEILRVRRDPDGRPSELDIASFVHTRQP